MICLVSREERMKKTLADKITKLGAVMMTKDLYEYSKFAEQTYSLVDSWRKNKNNLKPSLIEERKNLRGVACLGYLFSSIYESKRDLPKKSYSILFELLCNELDSLETNSQSRSHAA